MYVSEIGLGAWQLANPDWGINDKKEALEIVRKPEWQWPNIFNRPQGIGLRR